MHLGLRCSGPRRGPWPRTAARVSSRRSFAARDEQQHEFERLWPRGDVGDAGDAEQHGHELEVARCYSFLFLGRALRLAAAASSAASCAGCAARRRCRTHECRRGVGGHLFWCFWCGDLSAAANWQPFFLWWAFKGLEPSCSLATTVAFALATAVLKSLAPTGSKKPPQKAASVL